MSENESEKFGLSDGFFKEGTWKDKSKHVFVEAVACGTFAYQRKGTRHPRGRDSDSCNLIKLGIPDELCGKPLPAPADFDTKRAEIWRPTQGPRSIGRK